MRPDQRRPGLVSFEFATSLGGTVNFDEARFSGGSVSFDYGEFSAHTLSFDYAEFSAHTLSFDRARFIAGTVAFTDAESPGGQVHFIGAGFSFGKVSFGSAGSPAARSASTKQGSPTARSPSRRGVPGGTVGFDRATFSGGEVSFTGVGRRMPAPTSTRSGPVTSPPTDRAASRAGAMAPEAATRRAWLTASVASPTAPASSGADHESPAWRALMLMVVLGLLAAIVTGVFAGWGYAAAVGWIAAGSTFCVLTAARTKGKDAAETAAMAARDDPSPPVSDVLLLTANTASLVAVGYLLVQGHSAHGARQALLATLALVSVAVSWALVHVLYMLRYAVLYYSGDVGGINFNQQELPSFVDFAYLAFTIGMTYQVSDTNLESRQIRIAALRHALLSFVFGSLILASVVNLVAGLSR